MNNLYTNIFHVGNRRAGIALRILFVILIIVSGFSVSMAKIARRDPFIVRQPDGSVLTVVQRGDERNHQMLTTDGYLLMHTDSIGYVYADFKADGTPYASGIVAEPQATRGAKGRSFLKTISPSQADEAFRRKGASDPVGESAHSSAGRFATNFPVFGTQKALVILVEYADKKFEIGSGKAHDYFSRQLNEEGFSDNGATGSVRDWFIENSAGQFQPEFDLYGPITLANTRSYYGSNDKWGDDKHPEEMIIEACQQLDATVDFSQYDRDGDGVIDNVYVYYAGKGEADGGGAETVWPHSWEIFSSAGKTYYFDGVLLDKYACSNETDNYTKKPDGIGTFVHEFSHVLGLPDLYDTTSTYLNTPGEYSVLDYGPYNNDGRTPPNYSSFELNALGWIHPIVSPESRDYTLGPLSKEKTAIYIPTEKPDEFFLLENRQKEGNDKYLPGHGLLVWHVDYVQSVWDNNIVNNNPRHQYVDLVEADQKATDATMSGDPFPGTMNITSLTGETVPGLVSWSGKKTGFSITGITEANGNIAMNVENANNNSTDIADIFDTVDSNFVRIDDGLLLSELPAVVYDLAGGKIGSVAPGETLRLPSRGIYIVGASDKSVKIKY